MGRSAKTNSMKTAVVVFGALAFGWLTIEMLFKPFLDRARDAMDKSDPARDPDQEEAPQHTHPRQDASDGE